MFAPVHAVFGIKDPSSPFKDERVRQALSMSSTASLIETRGGCHN
jgi:hypothetical protein